MSGRKEVDIKEKAGHRERRESVAMKEGRERSGRVKGRKSTVETLNK